MADQDRSTRFVRPRSAWVSFALALAGVWVTGTLVKEHDGGWRQSTEKMGALLVLCNPANVPSVSCEDVIASRWGSFDVFFGNRRLLIPTSLVGLGYFLVLCVWLGLAGIPGRHARWSWRATWALVLSSVLASVFLSGVMAWTLRQWCPLCLASHAINLAIAGSLFLTWRSQRGQADKPNATMSAAVLIAHLQRRMTQGALVVAVLAIAGAWLYFDAASEARRHWRRHHGLKKVIEGMQGDREFMLREYFSQAQHSTPTPRSVLVGCGSKARGHEKPIATLTVFSNYDCKGCACFDRVWHDKLAAAVGDNVRVDLRYLPMAGRPTASNATEQESPTKGDAPLAVYAAEAARLLGGSTAFTRMHHLLFKHRDKRSSQSLVEFGVKAGMDTELFETELHSPLVRERVAEDVSLAKSLGVTGTPTVFLNGRQVPSLCLESETFWKAIGEELRADRLALARQESP